LQRLLRAIAIAANAKKNSIIQMLIKAEMVKNSCSTSMVSKMPLPYLAVTF
jgi:hypothetical protein